MTDQIGLLVFMRGIISGIFLVGVIYYTMIMIKIVVGIHTLSVVEITTKDAWIRLTLAIVFTIIVIYSIFSMNDKVIGNIKDMSPDTMEIIEIMYTSEANEIETGLNLHKDKFTDKGFQSVTSKDNIYNMLDVYNKDSSKNNKLKVKMQNQSLEQNCTVFTLTKEGEVKEKMGCFDTSTKGKLGEYIEYNIEKTR